MDRVEERGELGKFLASRKVLPRADVPDSQCFENLRLLLGKKEDATGLQLLSRVGISFR